MRNKVGMAYIASWHEFIFQDCGAYKSDFLLFFALCSIVQDRIPDFCFVYNHILNSNNSSPSYV
ncbi:hypothetical protein CRENPOLYSF2_1710004 [Crenothrix polyspora]|uniref:Uncharacterized protein n=1 Tax=Crenothrix polyspora TaxID=360316 RepID=A0A1R4H2V8_9GAMM|nr:hypothetical protein CRENPOLYSF2_1710004 [Crenothrix polyspora]